MSSSGTGGSLGDAEAAALLASEDILSRDNIPDKNQQTECFSCRQIMVGLFCHDCGQKNDDYRRSIWSLFSETFSSIFSIENRIWRTWVMLIAKPGLVSREFSDGKRTNWTSPVRVYLALSIILFGYMSITETRIFSVRTDIVPKSGFVGNVTELEDTAVRLSPDFGFFRRQAEIDQLNAGTDFDRVSRLMNGVPKQAFIFEDNLNAFGELPDNERLKSLGVWPEISEESSGTSSEVDQRTEALEIYAEEVNDAVDSYNKILAVTRNPENIGDRILIADIEGTPFDLLSELPLSMSVKRKTTLGNELQNLDTNLENLGLQRRDLHALPIEIRNGFTFDIGSGSMNGVELSRTDMQKVLVEILRNPALLNDGISRYLPRIMFLMMPFAALIGLVFIRGKKTALLYDHLVHATYIHAVTFAFLFVLILAAQWSPLTNMIQIFFIGILIYLPLSTKKMFQRGWFKTFFASYSIALLYGFIMLLIVTVLTAQSFVNVAKSGAV